MLLETKIDALDITVLRGGGDAVGRWAISHGFLLTPDAPEVLDFYSQRSKVFMAARFDATRAQDLGQNAGDGTPIMLTIPTDEPWVPLRILALGLDRTRVVNADVFLLTDDRPTLLAGDDGVRVARSEAASSALLTDLRSDKGMTWVPGGMWFTFVQVDTPAGALTHDLAVSTTPGALPSARLAGYTVESGGALAVVVVRSGNRGTPPPDHGWTRAEPAFDGGGNPMRRPFVVAATVAIVLAASAAVIANASGSDASNGTGVLGPGTVTVTIDVDHSHFRTQPIRVRPHTEVRFVIVNHDPIAHEFIIGGPEVHARHANGHEAYHPPVPGEVSVPAQTRVRRRPTGSTRRVRSSTRATFRATTSTACTGQWW